jgi:dipeptidyl-peptidase-3
VLDDNGNICDIKVTYDERYTDQMLRYGREYGTL